MPYIIVTHVMRCSHFSFKRMHTTRVYVIMLRAWHRQDGRAPPAATRIVQMIAELGFGGIEIWLLRMNWRLNWYLYSYCETEVKIYAFFLTGLLNVKRKELGSTSISKLATKMRLGNHVQSAIIILLNVYLQASEKVTKT